MPAVFKTIRSAMAWWNDQCQRDAATGHWIVPVTQDMLGALDWMDWPHMLKDEDLKNERYYISSIMPVFFMDEADANHFDRPRLDFVVSFDDGRAVRYHAAADKIWIDAAGQLEDPGDVEIIKKRRLRLQNLRRKHGRDWAR